MNWLWMAALGLLAAFLLVIIWYFFSDYSCCPFEKKNYDGIICPAHNATTLFDSTIIPSAPEESPMLELKLKKKKLSEVIFTERGLPSLDLHDMTIPEARRAAHSFLNTEEESGSMSAQIITGRGLHSTSGVAKIKPIIRNMLLQEGLQFEEGSNGGSFVINFHGSQQ